MGYRVDYDELYNISEEIRLLISDWFAQFHDLNIWFSGLQSSKAFQGQAAENISNYFKEVHGTALSCLSLLAQDLNTRNATYANLYKRDVDNGTHAVLHEQELKNEIPVRVEQLIGRARDANYRADLVGRDVSDLVGLPYPGGNQLADKLEEAREIPLKLHNSVVQYEDAHRNDFDNIDNLMDQVRSILQKQTSRAKVQPVVYTQGSIATICDIDAINNSAEAVANEINDLDSEFTEAMKQREAWDGELRQEREEKVKWIKIGVTVICAAASVAVTVATGGAAAPLLLATVGAIEGAVIAGTNELTDQYVETGFRHGVEWNKVGKAVTVGAVTGFVTGYVGGKLALQSGVGKTFGRKLLEKAGTNVLETASDAVTGSVYDIASGVIQGQSVSEIFDEAKKNWEKVPQDIVNGGIKAIVGTTSDELFDKAGDKLGDAAKKIVHYDKAGDTKQQTLKYIGDAVWGSATDTTTGIVKRFATETNDALFEGKDLGKADTWKEITDNTFSADKIVDDAVNGAVDSFEKDYQEANHAYQDRKLDAMMKELQNKDGKVEFVYFGNDESTVVLKRDYDNAVKLVQKYQNDKNSDNDKITVRDILGTRTDANPQFVSYTSSDVRAPYYQSDTKAVKASVK